MTDAMANRNIETPAMISIGLPVFNGEPYLERAIKSILEQTYPHFELIISDNASTDRTAEICRHYAALDSRIRYIRQSSNIGPSANFRFVLEAAIYDRFIWAAADDWWEGDRLEHLVRALQAEDAIVVGEIRRYIGTTCYAVFVPKQFAKGQWLKYLLREEARCEKIYYIYGLMWRRYAVECVDALLDGYWTDSIFCYRMLWLGNLKSIAGAAANVQSHSDSTGGTFAKSFRYSVARALYRAHPSSYYHELIRWTPANKQAWVAAAIPMKAVAEQIHLWWRAFRRLVLKRPFVHGALPDGERVVRDAGL